MSYFAVTLTRIAEIKSHPAADRLELAHVESNTFQFCVQKGVYKVGDEVLYFPAESVLPQHAIDRLDLWPTDARGEVIRDAEGRIAKTMLVGKDQNRIRTVELRGQVSQGMVCPRVVFVWDLAQCKVGDDVTQILGVAKYDPPTVQIVGATLKPLPDGLGEYDIDNAEFYPDLTEALMDVPVLITEKLEGVNFAIGRKADSSLFVVQRTTEIIEDESLRGTQDECTHWKVARAQDLESLVDIVAAKLGLLSHTLLALRAELIGPGVQGNHYDLKKQEIRIFDVRAGRNYLSAAPFVDSIPEGQRVPVLASNVTLRQWLAGRSLVDASNGPSVLNPQKLREGIVIKPMVEMRITVQKPKREDPHDPLSPIVDYVPVEVRAIIKQRSPKYLAKEQVK